MHRENRIIINAVFAVSSSLRFQLNLGGKNDSFATLPTPRN